LERVLIVEAKEASFASIDRWYNVAKDRGFGM